VIWSGNKFKIIWQGFEKNPAAKVFSFFFLKKFIRAVYFVKITQSILYAVNQLFLNLNLNKTLVLAAKIFRCFP